MRVYGKIEINTSKKTVTIHLKNGSYCLDHYTHGIKRFLDEEIELLQEQEQIHFGRSKTAD